MSQRAVDFHNSPWRGVYFVTGGGTSFIHELMGTPGASASVLEVQIPYAEEALAELLGRAPEQAAANSTARLLAMAAFQRAQSIRPDASNFGLGCTASLATNRVKRGQHRAHWAIQTGATSAAFSVEFSATREIEEQQLNDLLWQSVDHVLNGAPATQGLSEYQVHSPDPSISALLGTVPQRVCTAVDDGLLLLPGSFNPIHEGHKEMLRVGEQLTGQRGALEIAIRNADKPALDFVSLRERLATLADFPVWLTNTPTYAAKARLFPGATFLLGVDTLTRIAELRFYQNDPALLDAALQTFVDAEISFLVFGRKVQEQFLTLDALALPEILANRCRAVPDSMFRNDISSTALRNQS
ncbi:MAG: hypothetical protein AAF529_12755 [Pseudomonadota bacterium]